MTTKRVFIIIFISIFSPILASNNDVDDFIIGGGPVIATTVAYQVSIQSNELGHVCSGAIIRNRWILTSAHCCLTEFDYVKVGTNLLNETGFKHYIEKNIPNPNYKPVVFLNDICLLKTNQSILFVPEIQPIGLPSVRFPDNTSIEMTGWGVTKNSKANFSNDIQRLVTTSINITQCASMLRKDISRTVLCTYVPNAGACNGDLGNPLVASNILHGITIKTSCSKREPDLHTRVLGYVPWINRIIATN